MSRTGIRALLAGALFALAASVGTQIKVGVTVSATGPAASLGTRRPPYRTPRS